MRYVMKDVREESERYDTKQWNYLEILQSITYLLTYLLSDITESRDAIASKNYFRWLLVYKIQ